LALIIRILEERWLYLLAWAGLAAGLGLGRAIISVSMIVIACAWLFDGMYRKDFKSKLRDFFKNRPALLISSIPLIYLISLSYSSGTESGWKVLHTLAPLAFMPMIFSSMPVLDKKQIQGIAMIHVLALGLSTLLSYLLADPETIIHAPRKINLFVNHIRLSLLLVMGIVLIIRFLWSKKTWQIILNLLLISWFLYNLWIMESGTGFLILMILVSIFALRGIMFNGYRRWLGIMGLILIGITAIWIGLSAHSYWETEDIDKANLEYLSPHGNPYIHDLDNSSLENGNRIWMYVSRAELDSTWVLRSEMDLKGKDLKGQYLQGTLIRYLTSLGQRKDADAVMALSDEQVREIESGTTSAFAGQKAGIPRRLDVLFYEVDSYMNGGDPSLNSMTRRFELWKAGWGLFKAAPIIGHGAGNIRVDMSEQLSQGSRLSHDAWDLIHNQFLTFMACFGMLGFLWMIYAHYQGLTLAALRKEPLFLIFLLVLSISYMGEDTLNTQSGLSFFIFYYGLTLIAVYRPEDSRISV